MAGYIGKGQPVVSNGAERKFKYVATAGQTVFNATYSVGSVHVYRTGVRLTDGVDYTATNGSSVTLTTGCNAGDDVVIVGASGFQVADAFTKAELANHDLVTVDASGSVGIGTSSPSYKLDVKTTGSPSARIRSDDLGGTATLLLESANNFSGTSQAYIKGIGTAGSGLSQLAFGTAGSSGDTTATERMRIDSAGRVTIPYQPYVYLYGNNGDTYVARSAGENIPMYAVTQVGNHWNASTNTFTAPVAGVYACSWWTITANDSDQYYAQIDVNDATKVKSYVVTRGHCTSANLKLAAGDTVSFSIDASGVSVYGNGPWTGGSIHLIG